MLLEYCLLYLVYDYCGFMVISVVEECWYNLWLGGDVDEGDFIGYMENFGLLYLKLMDIVVLVNLCCG